MMSEYEDSRKAADIQRAHVAESKARHEREMSSLKSELKEDTERGLFDMSLTEKQMRGIKRITFTGSGNGHSGKFSKPKHSGLYSRCCKAEARLYRSVSYGRSKPPDNYYRCQECWNDCEIYKRKPKNPKRRR